jgi:enoyl-CoA hydratase
MTAVTIEQRGHVLLMGLNRPEKRNAFNLAMIDELAAAYHRLEADDEIRCGVLCTLGQLCPICDSASSTLLISGR